MLVKNYDNLNANNQLIWQELGIGTISKMLANIVITIQMEIANLTLEH